MKHQELTMNLINGECLQAMQGIPDKSVDMILCDLPYGTTANQWDHIIPVVPLWNEYERIIKDNGAIVLFTQPPFNFKLAYPRLNLFRYEWIWVKENATGFLNARRIKDIVDIDIPYPRDQETKMSPRFMELKNHIWSQVYQEYLEVRK